MTNGSERTFGIEVGRELEPQEACLAAHDTVFA